MSRDLHIRQLEAEDLPFAESLRALAGWNQTRSDWRRFLHLDPLGSFLAEWNRIAVGTVTTVSYGHVAGWIGMALVHPEYRRRGIGRALLEKAVGYLQNRGVACIKLDATPEGLPVYQGLAFQDEWTLSRWEGRGRAKAGQTEAELLGALTAECAELDSEAYGFSRGRLLTNIASEPGTDIVHTAGAFGLLRSGSRACYLGPVVATSEAKAKTVIDTLLNGRPEQPVYWDIPDRNQAAQRFATEHGFVVQRSLTRMFLGKNIAGCPALLQAIAGPELG